MSFPDTFGITQRMQRATVLKTLLLALCCYMLTACVAPVTPATTTAPDTAETPAPASTLVEEERDGYPLTITHALGDVTIPAAPQRIIALGWGDNDVAIALGFTPIAMSTDFYTENGISQWLQDKVDPAQIQLIDTSAEVSLEQLAALQPDLILATGHYGVEEIYDSLSQIAPTVIGIKGSGNDSWQEQATIIGQALNREEETATRIADTEAVIAGIRAEYPGIEGKSFSLSFMYAADAIRTIFAPTDFAVQFFNELGFVVTPNLGELTTPEMLTVDLSLEQMVLLDADMLVLAYGTPELQETLESSPIFQQLEAVQQGHYIAVDLETISALRSPTILAIPWVLEQLRPTLSAIAAE